MIRLALTTFFFAFGSSTLAALWYVPDDFATPQIALDNCQAEDTVVLRSGVYLGPILLPLVSVTLGSEYIVEPNVSYIENCIVRPDSNAIVRRCLDTGEEAIEDLVLNLVGITIADALSTGEGSEGGGIRIRYRTARISNCVFTHCLASSGGAIYAEQTALSVKDSHFDSSDAFSLGRVLFAHQSSIVFSGCDIGPSGYLMPPPSVESEFVLEDSELRFEDCLFHGLGTSAEGRNVAISLIDRSVCDSVAFQNCAFENNAFNSFISSGSRAGMRNFVLDSCRFSDNIVAFGLLGDFEHDSLRHSVVKNCVFENSRRPGPAFGGAGLFDFTDLGKTYIVEDNRFNNNDGGAFSCVHINGLRNPETCRLRRNHFSGNSNHNVTAPPGGAVFTSNLGEGVLERNAFVGNIGHAVDTWEFGPISYGRRNWWGDASGPFEQVNNAVGRGDTTDEHTIYENWLQSEEQINDTSDATIEHPRIPVGFAMPSAYPNPFNSNVTIEFVLLKDQEIMLDIFDLMGRHVETVLSGRMNKGVHIRNWQPESQASGIYFARLVGENNLNSTVKLLYMK